MNSRGTPRPRLGPSPRPLRSPPLAPSSGEDAEDRRETPQRGFEPKSVGAPGFPSWTHTCITGHGSHRTLQRLGLLGSRGPEGGGRWAAF